MELPLYNSQGTQSGTVAVSDKFLNVALNDDLVYQVATAQMGNQRTVLAHAKDRSEVRGGGKKPWKQKGTGRARHGSIRSPIWIGGGVAHGPTKDRNFKRTVTRVVARKALACVLSSRRNDGRLMVVDGLDVDGKTKSAVACLGSLTANLNGYLARKDKHSRVLVVLPGTAGDMAARRAFKNIPYADTIRAADLNTLTVLSYPFIVMTKDAVAEAEKVFGKKN